MAGKKSTTLINLSIERDDRVLRTSNPEFAAKQQSFLAKLHRSIYEEDTESDDSCIYIDDEDGNDEDFEMSGRKASAEKPLDAAEKKAYDMFCWFCHKDRGSKVLCTTCPRVYHYQCAKVVPVSADEKFRCYECTELEQAKKHDGVHFNKLLKLMLNKIIASIKAKERFQKLIRKNEYPKHLTYTVDLNGIIKNVAAKKYTSSKAFMLDIAWIGHIYTAHFPTRKEAMEDYRHLQKFCKDEIFNIETCEECYMNASSKNGYDWFVKVCTKPHLLIWAKLSGYPYWPAKVMSVFENVLSVQFFGEHERAFVPAKDCYLYSREDPNPVQPKAFRQQNFLDCVAEAAQYIKNVTAKFGQFYYAEFKTLLNPDQLDKHVLDMLAVYKQDTPSSAANSAAGASNVSKKKSVDRPNKLNALNAIADTKANDEQIVPKTPKIGISGKMAKISKSKSVERRNSVARTPSQAKSATALSREEKHKIAKRKTIEKAQELYYKSKMPKLIDYRIRYANIIENPGTLLLHRVDSPVPQCNTPDTIASVEDNDFVEETTSKWDANPTSFIGTSKTFMKGTPDLSMHDSDSSTPISPFPPATVSRNTAQPSFMSNHIPPIATPETPPIIQPEPSTSAKALANLSVLCTNVLEKQTPIMIAPPNAHAQPSIQLTAAQPSRVCHADSTVREKQLCEMSAHLETMIRVATEKMASLQGDWNAITSYASEMNNLRTTVDNAKANRSTQCVNCGETARLFCTWSAGYCDYPCREQYRAKYGEIHGDTQDECTSMSAFNQ